MFSKSFNRELFMGLTGEVKSGINWGNFSSEKKV